MGFFTRFIGKQKPAAGEQTPQQGVAQAGSSLAGIGLGQVPGFAQPQAGTYAVYRRMSSHPTLALVKSIVTAPILAASWSFEVRRPDGKPAKNSPIIGDAVASDPVDQILAERSRFIQDQLEPMRSAMLTEALRALEFGWRPFEKVWATTDTGTAAGPRVVLQKLKPLLPDFTFVQVDGGGAFTGIAQMDVRLGCDKAFIYTYDGEAGNHYGRSRHENVRDAWSRWLQLDERTGQLATKVTAIVPMVHYPLGQSRDAAGNVRDNGDLADVILAGLGNGKGVKLPNLFASSEDPLLNGDLAGKSAWVISFLEAKGAAANLRQMTDRQRYYDALMFRGWLRPERSALESRFGSRADASKHTATGLIDSELLHADVCAQLNAGVTDDLLAFNYGPGARGSVYVTPSPLQQEKRELFGKLFDAMWNDPARLGEFISQTDMDAVFDLMEIPKAETQAEITPAVQV